MNQSEYERWEEYLIDAFPSVSPWLQSLPDTENTRCLWAKALRSATLNDACEAVDRMLSGEISAPEKSAQDYPRLVAIEAKRIRAARDSQRSSRRTSYSQFEGEPTFECHHCQDIGSRLVWHWLSMQDALAGREIRVYPALVACTCEAGDASLRSLNHCRFNREKMLLYPAPMSVRGTPDRDRHLDELRDFVANLQLQTYAF